MTDRHINQEDGDTYGDYDVNGEDLNELNVHVKVCREGENGQPNGVQRLSGDSQGGLLSADHGDGSSVPPSEVHRVNQAVGAIANMGLSTSTNELTQPVAQRQNNSRNGGRGTSDNFVLEVNRPRKMNLVGSNNVQPLDSNNGHGRAADSNSASGT